MAPTLLPAEIGLVVIDQLGSEIVSFDTVEDYEELSKLHKILCVFATVCKDWVHRSRVNLYRVVRVGTSQDFSLLMRTLEAQPHLCKLVKDVRVYQTYATDTVPLHRILSMARSKVYDIHSLHFVYEYHVELPALPSPARACLAIGFPEVTSLSLQFITSTRAVYLLRGFPHLQRFTCSTISEDLKKPCYLSLRQLAHLDVSIYPVVSN